MKLASQNRGPFVVSPSQPCICQALSSQDREALRSTIGLPSDRALRLAVHGFFAYLRSDRSLGWGGR